MLLNLCGSHNVLSPFKVSKGNENDEKKEKKDEKDGKNPEK